MIIKKVFLALIAILFIAGCSIPFPISLNKDAYIVPPPNQAVGISGNRLIIRLDGINKILAKSLPIKRSGSFGKVKVLNILVSASPVPQYVTVGVRFNLVRFEIPEGVNIALEYQASFRYDPMTRLVFFKDIKVSRPMVFSNNSLAGYVPLKDRETIAKIIANVLETIPICQLPKDFKYKSIKSVSLVKDVIYIDFN